MHTKSLTQDYPSPLRSLLADHCQRQNHLSDDEFGRLEITASTTHANAAGDRKFAVTNNGHMALVPGEMEPGDKVCIVLGAEMPFVLRRHRKLGPDNTGVCDRHELSWRLLRLRNNYGKGNRGWRVYSAVY
jgi:hypothetical protein